MTDSPQCWALGPATLSETVGVPQPPRRRRHRRVVAAVAATLLMAASLGGGPLVAMASAQGAGGVLQQSVGGGTTVSPQARTTTTGTGATGTANLNPEPDFSGPGIAKGVSLIGWAKAACLVIGVLTLTIGIPASKSLKEAGNHHASGIRAGVIGVGGATLLAGTAGVFVPWLMA